MNGNAMLKPALWGALVIGVLSGLPLVSAGNCCCCAWIVTGGMLAAYLLQNGTPTPIMMGDGALVGLLAGLMSAPIRLVVSVPMDIMMGPIQLRFARRLLESNPDIPDNVRQALDSLGGGAGVSLIGIALSFVTSLLLGAVFASVGGLLGAFFFKTKEVPVQPPAPIV
jgi:hypothetical protein